MPFTVCIFLVYNSILLVFVVVMIFLHFDFQIEADVVSEGSVISEYLYFSEADKRKAWTKMWCVIPRNEPCLYVYGANQVIYVTASQQLTLLFRPVVLRL